MANGHTGAAALKESAAAHRRGDLLPYRITHAASDAVEALGNGSFRIALSDLRGTILWESGNAQAAPAAGRRTVMVGVVEKGLDQEALKAMDNGYIFDYLPKAARYGDSKDELAVVLSRYQKCLERFTRWHIGQAYSRDMVTENLKRRKARLLRQVRANGQDDAWAAERLDQIYRHELEPILKNLKQGKLPGKRDMKRVKHISDEIEDIRVQVLPEANRYLTRIMQYHRALTQQQHLNGLNREYRAVRNRILHPNGLTGAKIGGLKRKLRSLSKKISSLEH